MKQIVVQSAIKLSAEQKKEIAAILEKKFSDAEISYEVHEALIGGIRVNIGSSQVDLSVQGKLSQVKSQLA